MWTQQQAVTRQRHANNRKIVFSAQSVSMAALATLEYILPLLCNSFSVIEERRVLRGLLPGYYKQDKLAVEAKMSCGGGLKYLHRRPASRKRRQKGTQCPGV
jgi:hypothetical protein